MDRRVGRAGGRAARTQDRHQRIDDGVPRDEDAAPVRSLVQQVELSAGSGGEQHVGEGVDRPAVHLLGEGLLQIVAAQSGLDVGHHDPRVEGGQRSGQGGRGVTLYQDEVGPPRVDLPREPPHGGAHDLGGCLPRMEQPQVGLDVQVELTEDLQHGIGMLSRAHQPDLDVGGLTRRPGHRCELHGLRPGAQQQHEPQGPAESGQGTLGFGANQSQSWNRGVFSHASRPPFVT